MILYFSSDENFGTNLIKYIDEINDNDIIYYPFIVFISKKPREYYLEYMNQNQIKLDPLNILSFNNSKYEFILKELEDLENYYHEKTNKVIVNNTGINLCVLGNPGKGKSSFINCIAGKKISLEGNKRDTTKHFNKYIIHKSISNNYDGIINIYDCPGFGIYGNEIKMIEKSIEEKFAYFKRNHDFIHGFLYFIYKDKTERTLNDGEVCVLDTIYKLLDKYNQNAIILFIINNHMDDENSKNSYKERLFSELNRIKELKGKFENKNTIIYVNLKNNIKGIDKVFSTLYDYLSNHKINIPKRNANESEDEFNEKKNLY